MLLLLLFGDSQVSWAQLDEPPGQFPVHASDLLSDWLKTATDQRQYATVRINKSSYSLNYSEYLSALSLKLQLF